MNRDSGHRGRDGRSARAVAEEIWFQLPTGQVRQREGACGVSAPVAGEEFQCPHDPAALLTLSCAWGDVVRDVPVCSVHLSLVHEDAEAGWKRCVRCRTDGDDRAAYIYAELPLGPRAAPAPDWPGEGA